MVSGVAECRRVRTHPTTVLPVMTAIEVTRATGNQSGDAPTDVQPPYFDARKVLAGRVDDTTVRQAVKGCQERWA